MRLSLIMVALTVSIGHSQTREISGEICGTLYADTTYIVTGNLVVGVEGTLTVEAGTRVQFTDSVRLEVRGRLTAVGTPGDTIIFTRHGINDRWLGIRLLSASNSSRIEYCRIEYGYARPDDGPNGAHYGGGIGISDCSPVIRNNHIRYCRAVRSGGAIGCYDYAHPLIESNTLEYDTTGIGGGAILVLQGSAPTIRNNIMRYNQTVSLGGAIDVNGTDGACNPVIEGNHILHNRVTGGDGGGISVKVNNSKPTIRNNLIAFNSATVRGGGIYIKETGNGEIYNNLIIGDTSNASGGRNGGGGGIAFYDPLVTIDSIYNNTIAGNYCNTTNAEGAGGGIYVSGSSTALLLKSNILWGNGYRGSNNAVREIYRKSGTVRIDSCVIEGGIYDGSIISNGIQTGDPLFRDAENNDYSLCPGSSAIDNGSVITYTVTDLAGYYRWVDGDSSGTGYPDIGAFEFMPGGQGISAMDLDYAFVVNSDSEAVLNFSSLENTNGVVSVYAYKNRYPHDKGPGKAVKRWYDIRAEGMGAFVADMTLFYGQDEFNASGIISENGLQLYRNAGSAWHRLGGDVNSLYNRVSKSDVSAFSRFTFADAADSPLPVMLTSFRALQSNGSILVEWITASEIDNLGFAVYRAENPDGPYSLLWDYRSHQELRTTGNSSSGNVYRMYDRAAVKHTSFCYKLYGVDLKGEETEIGQTSIIVDRHIPTTLVLGQNYPNPFNSGTVIQIWIPGRQKIILEIFNCTGQVVDRLLDTIVDRGTYHLNWDAEGLSTGVYYYKITGERQMIVRKMLLIR